MIGIVSCSAKKLARPGPARELYTSHLFKLSLAYALEQCEHVYVASARYGLVPLDLTIQTYNESLTSKSRAQRDAWGFAVCRQLLERHPAPGGVVVLAGYAYAAPIRKHLDKRYILVDVLHGMQIGQRLQWLRNHITSTNLGGEVANAAAKQTPLSPGGRRRNAGAPAPGCRRSPDPSAGRRAA